MLALLLLGIIIMGYGISFNISHIDNYNDESHSFFDTNAVIIGYFLLIIAPLFIRKYIWSLVLLSLAIAFIAWIYISRMLQ